MNEWINTVSAPMLPHSWKEPQVMWKVQFLGFFLNKPPLFDQKVHFLRDFLNWPPPKNPYWKIEPWGSIRADTVYISLFQFLEPFMCLDLSLYSGREISRTNFDKKEILNIINSYFRNFAKTMCMWACTKNCNQIFFLFALSCWYEKIHCLRKGER